MCAKNQWALLLLICKINNTIIMEKLLNVENDWDGEVDCHEVMWPCCLISKEEVATASKRIQN